MRLCIFEDGVEQLEPLSLTRPVFALRCGLITLAQKIARHVTAEPWGVLVRPMLGDLIQAAEPGLAINDAKGLRGDDLLLVNGRWLPPDADFSIGSESHIGMAANAPAYVFLRKDDIPVLRFEDLPDLLDQWQQRFPHCTAGGRLISHPWDLVDANGDETTRDFAWLCPPDRSIDRPSLVVNGPIGNIWIAPTARIEPMVIADATKGPVVIAEDAVVTAFTRLEGPCTIGPRSQILGAKIRAGTSIGNDCRVGGEVEASIVHGYSNKYHDGFLGHSYVGEWVNLGAGTHNSDLRNDYGEVTVVQHGVSIPTGMNKVGCFLGDHTKTGLGTLLNTGTNVGAFCNLLPAGRFAPKYVPSFTSWWNGSLQEAFTLEQMLTTARIAMQRRGVTLTPAHETLYTTLYEEMAIERRRTLRDSEQRQLRRSA